MTRIFPLSSVLLLLSLAAACVLAPRPETLAQRYIDMAAQYQRLARQVTSAINSGLLNLDDASALIGAGDEVKVHLDTTYALLTTGNDTLRIERSLYNTRSELEHFKELIDERINGPEYTQFID